MKALKRFAQDETGAVTVDWVVLTAAVVGLAVAIAAAIDMNTTALMDSAANAVTQENDFGAGA